MQRIHIHFRELRVKYLNCSHLRAQSNCSNKITSCQALMSNQSIAKTKKVVYNNRIDSKESIHLDNRILMNYSDKSVYKKADDIAREFFNSPLAPAGLPLVLETPQYSLPYAVGSYERFQELLASHHFCNPSGISLGKCRTYSPVVGINLSIPEKEAREAINHYKNNHGEYWLKEATEVVSSGSFKKEWSDYARTMLEEE